MRLVDHLPYSSGLVAIATGSVLPLTCRGAIGSPYPNHTLRLRRPLAGGRFGLTLSVSLCLARCYSFREKLWVVPHPVRRVGRTRQTLATVNRLVCKGFSMFALVRGMFLKQQFFPKLFALVKLPGQTLFE